MNRLDVCHCSCFHCLDCHLLWFIMLNNGSFSSLVGMHKTTMNLVLHIACEDWHLWAYLFVSIGEYIGTHFAQAQTLVNYCMYCTMRQIYDGSYFVWVHVYALISVHQSWSHCPLWQHAVVQSTPSFVLFWKCSLHSVHAMLNSHSLKNVALLDSFPERNLMS